MGGRLSGGWALLVGIGCLGQGTAEPGFGTALLRFGVGTALSRLGVGSSFSWL